MKQHGGIRLGAGRKIGSISKKTIEEAAARGILVNRLLARWETVADTCLDLALGRIEYVRTEGGRRRVYTRPPDARMLEAIIEIVIGKPKQNIEGSINLPELQQLAADIRSILTRN
jgi:hypothetical protein